MRLIIVCLTALLLLIQYPLWLGKGGWLSVRKLDGQVQLARKKNDELRARNAKLESEVHDLQQGTGAIEERARYELGMIRQNEIFIQVLDANGAPVAAPAGAAGSSAPGAVAVPASPPATASASPAGASAPASSPRH
ncbi:cell division protein FtsB [Oxalobacteraceae bacterium CAVE-383]|nr:cell division protein FtsB [Oxalobacteraceae bacterium CAVE-383]